MNKDVLSQTLKSYFGFDCFRPMQEEIILHTVAGGDSLVLMPTGGGKSLCYQISALVMDGMAVVVSPLISLMKDQVRTLKANGISAEAVNSGNDEDVNSDVIYKCIQGEVKLLYVSPERLLGGLIQMLRQTKVSLFAIDEAHCVSAWGHDFRPEYTQLGQIRDHFPGIPIMALTATADKITKLDIMKQLRIEQGETFVGSFDRPNLSLAVKKGYTESNKLRSIVQLIKRHPQECGIIYCLARKTTEQLAEKLAKEGFSVGVYHAGLPIADRNRVQDDFVNDKIQVICATIAFGMGIDKSNVRFVAHYNIPKSIESFYQEIGRGGRDGLPCETILFYNLDDIITLRKFADDSGQQEINREKLQRMQEYAESRVCRRRILLNYFGEMNDRGCGNCDVCLNPPSTFDGTILVQKALSAIMRTNETVGFTTCINVLRGRMSSDVVNGNYQHLKTFATGRDVSSQDWYDLLLQMLQMGFIEVAYNEDRHIHVTSLGFEVLYGKRIAELAVVHHSDSMVNARFDDKGERRKNVSAPDIKIENKELFEKLRELRKMIADENHWPAYVVLSDKSLHALATERPTTLEEFGDIFGIGANKRDVYGERFIKVISEFALTQEDRSSQEKTSKFSDIKIENKELFEKLRELRKMIAAENHWPAYIVLSDKSLHALATERPTTLEEFGNIFGIGAHKRDVYGERFIKVIREFASTQEDRSSHETTSKPELSDKSISYKERQKQLHAKAYEPWTDEDEERLVSYVNQGLTTKEIAKQLNRNSGGISSRIKKLGLERPTPEESVE